MPQIQLTVPEGALTADGEAGIQAALARALMKWEGAPDTDFFRALSWSYLHQIPMAAMQTAADDGQARFRVDVTVPDGALNDKRRAGLAHEVTELVLTAAGLSTESSSRVWVLIHEQPDGTWSVGGQIFRYADLVAMTKG